MVCHLTYSDRWSRFLIDSTYILPPLLTIFLITLLLIMSILGCLWRISVTIFQFLPYLIDVFSLVKRKVNLYVIDLTIGWHVLIFVRLWAWIYGIIRFVPLTLISIWTPLTWNFIRSTTSISLWSLKMLYKTKLKPWMVDPFYMS